MPDVEERLGRVELRLDSVEGAVRELRSEVGELRGEVGELRGEVHELRIVVETHGSEIARIGEVLGHHGRQLEQITLALRPLNDIKEFITLVAHDHERRITALEARARDN